MIRLKTKSIWEEPSKRFYNFLEYADKYNLKKNILIIGCSDGTYAIPAAKRGFDVVGLEIDKDAIYGGTMTNYKGEKVKYLGLKKRIELEEDINGKINYELCDYMDYNTTQKFSLIFTSGSIHYEYNKKHDLDKMIFKMLDMLDDDGILLLEYIHKTPTTDNNRYFVTKDEIESIFSKYKKITIMSHKVKKYIEQPNPRDNTVHEISWGRIYVRKINKFVDDYESAKYYDALPRFSKNVYDYLKKIGVDKKVVVDVGSGTGRITIDLLENGNKVYAVDPDSNMRAICEEKCKKYKTNFISIDGTDANMNIPDKSVDYVVVSQSYHRFEPQLFKKECKRVLKNRNNVIIIWYRIDFTNPIIKSMLQSLKKNYKNYETRYDCDEITGARIEENENNIQAAEFFNNNSHMENVESTAVMDLDEFLRLGLSLTMFPITHKMNSVNEVLKQESFKTEEYIKDLEDIFYKYSKDGKIELKFNVQIHHSNK